MSCKTCPHKIRCFFGLRKNTTCPPSSVSTAGSVASASTAGSPEARAVLIRDPRPFNPAPSQKRVLADVENGYNGMVVPRPVSDVHVETAEGRMLKAKYGAYKSERTRRVQPAPVYQQSRSEVVHTQVESTNSSMDMLLAGMLLNEVLDSTPDVVYIEQPAYSAPVCEAPAPSYESSSSSSDYSSCSSDSYSSSSDSSSSSSSDW